MLHSKKIVTLFALAIMTFSLAACGKKQDDNNMADNQTSDSQTDNQNNDSNNASGKRVKPNHYSTYVPCIVDGNEEMLRLNFVLDMNSIMQSADIHFAEAEKGNAEQKKAFGDAASEMLKSKSIEDYLGGVDTVNNNESCSEALHRGIKLVFNAATNNI